MGQPHEFKGGFPAQAQGPRLLDRVREAIRRKHYSRRTEETYVHWIKRFIYHYGKRHPKEMGAAEVTAFLNHLAAERHVASSTQNQALAALLFLYREALGHALPWLDGLDRAKHPVRLPMVLSEAEVRALLAQLEGTKWLMASLLYGAGLRLRECLMLRVKDVDFSYHQILVRESKGGKNRSVDPETGVIRRHHICPDTLHRTVKRAAREAGIYIPVSSHTLRHSFATHLLMGGCDIRTVQELLGHKEVSTTMVYTHVMNKGGRGVKSPLDSGGGTGQPPLARDIAATYGVPVSRPS